MIELDKPEEWAKLKVELKIGQVVDGKVLAHWPFGIFVEIGRPFVGLVEITNFKEKGDQMTPSEYPAIGAAIKGVVVQLANYQVRLSLRPSDMKVTE